MCVVKSEPGKQAPHPPGAPPAPAGAPPPLCSRAPARGTTGVREFIGTSVLCLRRVAAGQAGKGALVCGSSAPRGAGLPSRGANRCPGACQGGPAGRVRERMYLIISPVRFKRAGVAPAIYIWVGGCSTESPPNATPSTAAATTAQHARLTLCSARPGSASAPCSRTGQRRAVKRHCRAWPGEWVNEGPGLARKLSRAGQVYTA